MQRIIFTAALLLPLLAGAQNLHLSVMGGLSNYSGDLHPKFYALGQSKFHFALGAKYDVSEKISLRSHFTYGTIQGFDAKGGAGNRSRNLDFKSKLMELQAGAEYHLFSFNDQWWTPYVFACVGVYNFKPYTATGGKRFLQPLGTEGQGLAGAPKKYGRTQLCLPMGVGFKYAIDEDSRVGIEFGFRKTFTDYLDDVGGKYYDAAQLTTGNGAAATDLAYRGDEVGAGPYPAAGTQRANSNGKKDMYYFTSLTFSTRLILNSYKRIAGISKGPRAKKVGCPSSKGIF
jgi:hypothetical protein